MPPRYSRSRKVKPRIYRKKARKPLAKISKPLANTVKAIVKKQLNKVVETKKSVHSNTDGIECYHNNFITVDDEPLFTSQGTADPNATDNQNRIGDKVLCKGVSMKMMVELNERYSDVTCRLVLIRSSRNDTPTRATLFCGASGNKMLDTINTERFTIIAQKFFKLKAPNQTVVSTSGTTSEVSSALGGNAGIEYPAQSDWRATLSRATKIIKLWIPGYKFGKGGVITYDSGGNKPKLYDYHLFLYSYSNYTTNQDLWYVSRLNDYVCTMYFQDA